MNIKPYKYICCPNAQTDVRAVVSFLLFFFFWEASATVRCQEIDVNGVKMTFQILNEDQKTVQIGNGKEAAIPTETTGALTIPSTVMLDDIEYTVADMADSAFFACKGLTSVEIPGSVAFIGPYAFYQCTSLSMVTIEKGVYGIRKYAFYGCTALEEIDLPYTIGSLGDCTFKGCSKLREVTAHFIYILILGKEVFASIAPDCKAHIPVGKLTAYHMGGWTKDLFGGGIIEYGEAKENYCVENGITTDFIKNVVYPNDDYSYTKIEDYYNTETEYLKDLPYPVRIKAPAVQEGQSMILETYSGNQLIRTDWFCIGQRLLEIWNLIPQTSYTYRLYFLDFNGQKRLVGQGSFKTEGQVRTLNITDMSNFRDLGGWSLPNGRHIRYDKLFRSGDPELDITPEGLDELLNILHIGVELDFGDYSDSSPAEDFLEFVHGEDYQIVQYAPGLQKTSNQYKNCFAKIVSSLRQGKKVLMHCTCGADRTGTLVFMLEGLLGMSESDIAKDYELTNFFLRKRFRSPQGVGYYGLVDYVKKNFSGNTLNEKIQQMALSFGISQKDIDDFRELMTESDDNPTASDIVKMASTILGKPTATDNADINGDGIINIADIILLVNMILTR